MSWTEVKGSINSDITVPLNHLLWLNDYKTFGQESFVFNDKRLLHELFTSAPAFNDKQSYHAAWTWLAANENGRLAKYMRKFVPFIGYEDHAVDTITDILMDAEMIERIVDLGYEKFFDIQEIYGRISTSETAKSTLRYMYTSYPENVIDVITGLAKFKSAFNNLGNVLEKKTVTFSSSEFTAPTPKTYNVGVFLLTNTTSGGVYNTVSSYYGTAIGISYMTIKNTNVLVCGSMGLSEYQRPVRAFNDINKAIKSISFFGRSGDYTGGNNYANTFYSGFDLSEEDSE